MTKTILPCTFLFLLLLLILPGCDTTIKVEVINTSILVCDTNGGIHKLIVHHYSAATVQCANHAKFYIKPDGHTK